MSLIRIQVQSKWLYRMTGREERMLMDGNQMSSAVQPARTRRDRRRILFIIKSFYRRSAQITPARASR